MPRGFVFPQVYGLASQGIACARPGYRKFHLPVTGAVLWLAVSLDKDSLP
jgi:hypothetical protein